MERDWQQGSVTIKNPAVIDTLTKSFNVTAQSDAPAPTVADVGPATADYTMDGGLPFQAGGWRCHVAGRNDKTGHRQCCKSSSPPLTQSVREALEGSSKNPRLPKFNAGFRDNV